MKIYNKLVRDRIPDIISEDGKSCKIRKLDEKELLYELKRKLVEESKELLSAESRENVVEEVADILEVLNTFLERSNISNHIVEKVRKSKRSKRGTFEKGFYLVSIE